MTHRQILVELEILAEQYALLELKHKAVLSAYDHSTALSSFDSMTDFLERFPDATNELQAVLRKAEHLLSEYPAHVHFHFGMTFTHMVQTRKVTLLQQRELAS